MTTQEQINWLDNQARESCLHEQHAPCYAAAEAIVRRLGGEDLDVLRRQRVELHKRRRYGDVFIDVHGIPFVVLEPDQNKDLKLPLAVSMYEMKYHIVSTGADP